jgi:threonyl-tRNA synthetase
MERFCGVLIEHFAGSFPLWLAPEQIRILPITDAQNDFAKEASDLLKSAGLRVEMDVSSDKLGAKIRRGQLDKIPYLAVIGAREAEARSLAIRSRAKGEEGVIPLEKFFESASREYKDRLLPGSV